MRIDSSKKRIGAGAVMSYVAIFVNIICGLIYTPWLISLIGQSNYGLYTLSTSLINLFLLDFGISASVSRFISKYEAEGDRSTANEYACLFHTIYLIIDAFICIALIIAYFFLGSLYTSLTPNELIVFKRIYIICAICSVVSFPFSSLTNGILNSYELFSEQKICSIIQKVLPIILVAISLLFGINIYSVVTINAVCQVLAILAKIYIIKKKTPISFGVKKVEKHLFIPLVTFTMWTAVTGISDQIINNLQPSILGVVSGSVMIAIYGVAAAIQSYIYTFTTAINGLFLPYITRLSVNDKRDELLSLAIRIGRVLYIAVGIIFVGFICIGKQFIDVWIGHDYSLAYYCVIVMTVPALVMRPQQIANTTMIVKGYVKPIAIIDIATAVLDMIISVILSKKLGALGAASALGITCTLGAIAKIIAYKRYIDINIIEFINKCYIRTGIPILVSTVIAYFMSIRVKSSWYSIAIGGFLITVVYFALVYIVSFNKSEKHRLIENVRRLILKQ